MSTVEGNLDTNEGFEEEHVLPDLEAELQQVQTIKLHIRQRLDDLLHEQKVLKQQQQRRQRRSDRLDSGAPTARMRHLQEKQQARHAEEEAKRKRYEIEKKAKAEEAQRKRKFIIETQDKDLDDLDAFLVQDAVQF
ncbi:hypothetical protein CCR75_008036 [Bremia lactucae]|uniref:Uncharacterized protein n=1 Tax=Bremia lactucae TaxID=4779 RepID=A0A976IBB0_BRELC|nr:hypothetical protein CCR75_008036 [Bremia lactucae]